MGQQQLLLLILGIVIVGLAVVVGINAFSEGRQKTDADALVSDGLRIASDAQAWALKPRQAGGGGSVAALAVVLFSRLGYPTDASGGYSNANGTYGFALSGLEECEVTIPSGKDPLVYILGVNARLNGEAILGEDDVAICIGIAGTNADDIGTDVVYFKGGGSLETL